MREKLVELLKKAKAKKQYDFLFGDIDTAIDMPHGAEYYADYLIANGVTVQEWIPVTERLPEEDGIYLTFNISKQYEFHLFQIGKRMWQGIWEEDGVTHWMPLPQPPKGE